VAAERFEDRLRRHLAEQSAPLTWTGTVAPQQPPIVLSEEIAVRLADLVAAVRKISVRPIEGTIPAAVTEVFSALAALDEAVGRG
jgi:hypothetical protein